MSMTCTPHLTAKCTSVAGLLLGVGANAAMAADLPPTSEPDLVRYAITQGGLLALTLIGLYMYRRDFLSQIQRKNELIDFLAGLIEKSTSAADRMTAASERQEQSIARLEATMARWDERRKAQEER